ncbi:class F sortase [Streptomyces himalayensis]|uniref:Class F sortase n=2 Tax=Streptomyces himalayensis TaxID=2820085 RepID=A0A7W2CYZ7_9ACTN|nr:class F sortase [Streptomyces himalayensis]MBA2950359.1 class F sortase [Streptomyces himalayensis subsp. himalayensis]MBA4861717.1 class F sortase [Streptomyces himalayensis subsp. aureolus]
MAAPQSPEPDKPRTAPASRTVVRAMLWPVAAVVLGALLIHNSLEPPADLKPQARPSVVASAPSVKPSASSTPRPSPSPTGPVLPRSAPKRISIPAISVDAPFTALSLGASGRLNAPPVDNKNLVGWFKDGASPGERGTSIVVGHVDTKTGPAVFVELSELQPGNRIDITRADGSVAHFEVDSVETFSKAEFPDDRVYAHSSSPELRLITCGGAYDRVAQDYEDNVVAFAHLDSVKRA